MELPDLIEYKKYKDDEYTLEQQIFGKILTKQPISEKEENILDELISFYKETTNELEKIDLTSLTEEDYNDLCKFLQSFYNIIYPVQNKLDFQELYRVCIVNEGLREKGKIRHPKYISFPELSYLTKRGKLNRANTFNSTLLYASSNLRVAMAEIKPQKDDYIIISKWEKTKAEKLNSYPIVNCEKEIANEFLKQSAQAFKQMYTLTHPKFAQIIDINLQFLASEFIKKVDNGSDKGYEYSFSSYYSDQIIDTSNFDCIIYPSVPFEYKADNVAIKPDNLKDYINITKGIKLILVQECKVKSIDYSKMDLNTDFYTLEFIRESDWFKNDDIIWNDD